MSPSPASSNLRTLLGLLAALSGVGVTGCMTAADHKACAESCECRTLGRCAATRKGCAPASEAHCKSSKACTTLGRCGYAEGQCVTRGDDDCKSAEICTKGNLCRYADGRCVL